MSKDAHIQTKADFAQRVLADPVFEEVMEDLQAEIYLNWSEETLDEQRNKLWHEHKALDAFRERLEGYLGEIKRQDRIQARKK